MMDGVMVDGRVMDLAVVDGSVVDHGGVVEGVGGLVGVAGAVVDLAVALDRGHAVVVELVAGVDGAVLDDVVAVVAMVAAGAVRQGQGDQAREEEEGGVHGVTRTTKLWLGRDTTLLLIPSAQMSV